MLGMCVNTFIHMWTRIFFIFKILFCEIKILGKKYFKTLAKLVKFALEKHISPPNSPTFFSENVEFLEFFIGSSFFKWGCMFLLAFLVTCTLSISLSRTLTHFNSLFGQVSQVSTLSFEKSHMFQFSLLTSLTHFNVSIELHATSFCW